MCSTPWSHHPQCGIYNLSLHMEYEEVHVDQNEPYIFFSYYLLNSKNLERLLKIQNNLITICIVYAIIYPKMKKMKI
jgi:hypothetical protein